MVFDKNVRTLIVFSHPNHELAVFGILKRLRPYLLYLTDGGGEDRVLETRKGLDRLGLLDRATFLPYTEQSFYDGILNHDVLFFSEVRESIRSKHRKVLPSQVLCDGIEFYNPVHDITLPLVISALGTRQKVYEIPLIHQRQDNSFGVQMPPPEFMDKRFEMKLTDEEIDMKRDALYKIYNILRYTLGHVLLKATHPLVQEIVFPAQDPLRGLGSIVLRYELRAKKLKAQHKIQREITRQGNFIPLVSQLLA